MKATLAPAGAVMEDTPFGTMPDGRPVHAFRLSNGHGLELRFLSLGGTITNLLVPGRDGRVDDVTTGYDRVDDYLASTTYFGALIGRYANRIDRGRFLVDDHQYQVAVNNGENHLHGGPGGFHAVLWDVTLHNDSGRTGAALRLHCADGSDGFPGTLDITVTYTLTRDNAFTVDYVAESGAPTPVNVTQHFFVNLDGHSSGDILGHELRLFASRFTPVRPDLIPTGELRPVAGTPFDFLRPHPMGSRLDMPDEQLACGGGYDHNFVLDASSGPMLRAARLRGPSSGRVLEIFTTEPGLQLYGGQGLDAGPVGKGGIRYGRHAAVALETQHFPDSPNHAHFPSTILRPGVVFRSRTVYRFFVDDQ